MTENTADFMTQIKYKASYTTRVSGSFMPCSLRLNGASVVSFKRRRQGSQLMRRRRRRRPSSQRSGRRRWRIWTNSRKQQKSPMISKQRTTKGTGRKHTKTNYTVTSLTYKHAQRYANGEISLRCPDQLLGSSQQAAGTIQLTF